MSIGEGRQLGLPHRVPIVSPRKKKKILALRPWRSFLPGVGSARTPRPERKYFLFSRGLTAGTLGLRGMLPHSNAPSGTPCENGAHSIHDTIYAIRSFLLDLLGMGVASWTPRSKKERLWPNVNRTCRKARSTCSCLRRSR